MSYALEAKHVGGFEKTHTILERYAAQAHWLMIVTGTKKCVFSIIEGNRGPVIEVMEFDPEYAAELWRRAEQFMECVRSLTPPAALPPVAAPIKAEKTYDMTGKNRWANEAMTWILTREAAKDNATATKAIREMVPADAVKCFGHGIEVKRNKAGALSIKEME